MDSWSTSKLVAASLGPSMPAQASRDFFASYMTKAKSNMDIGLNEVALDFVLRG